MSLRTTLATLALAGATSAAATSAAAAVLSAQTTPPAPKSTGEAWQINPLPQSSLVYARDGSLIGEIGKEWRTNVSIKSLPKYVAGAFIAIEDKRFYSHDGVDLYGVAGAIKDNLLGEHRGASTITQQLVGNLHPDLVDRRDRGIGRKFREQSAAREMEKHYTKEQILETYINAISFGHGWYGIEAASRHYFGKSAAKLTLAEAATLAGMPKGPAIYDPAKNPDKAKARRNTILDLMATQGIVSETQAAGAKAQPIETAPLSGMPGAAQYVVDLVRRQAERAGVMVSDGGYKLYTTIDASLQRAANDAVASVTAELEAKPTWRFPTRARHAKGGTTLQAAVVSVDPTTGDIRALIGGRDFRDAPFNRAIDGLRQPGSSFKPVVYAAALAQGLLPNAIVADTAISISLDNGETYAPKNADGKFLGFIPLREALAKSRNAVAVQLFQRAGADSVIALAHRMGIDAPIAPYPSSALGASAVQPLDLVQAYATIDNLGTAIEPRVVQRVEDPRGRTVWAPGRAAPVAAMDPRIAFLMRDLLREPVERGTAAMVRRYVPARIPLAGKTGTTDDNADVWFVGMTPDIVTGVWLGLDRPRSLGSGEQGGTLAAPVFARMIGQWYAGRGTQGWPLIDGLVPALLDRKTGAAADETTPPERRYVEFFMPGTEPPAVRLALWRRWRWVPDVENAVFLPPEFPIPGYTTPTPPASAPPVTPAAPKPN
jgi:penicillin-binding protein 1A